MVTDTLDLNEPLNDEGLLQAQLLDTQRRLLELQRTREQIINRRRAEEQLLAALFDSSPRQEAEIARFGDLGTAALQEIDALIEERFLHIRRGQYRVSPMAPPFGGRLAEARHAEGQHLAKACRARKSES